MKYLHPPGAEERFTAGGTYEVAGAAAGTETWERHRRTDGFVTWRFEQAGSANLRLGHLVVNEGGTPERLQIHQRGDEVGLQRQTYTFFEDGVLVTDNRIAGRRMVDLPEGWTLLTPFAAAGALAFPFAPTHEEPAEQFVYIVSEKGDSLLEGRLDEITFEPSGSDEQTVGGTEYVAHGWRLRRQDQPEDVLWVTMEGLTLKWLRDGRTATLTNVRMV